MLDGVTISESKAQKDELILEGNDVQNVSQSGGCIVKLHANDLDSCIVLDSRINPGCLPSQEQGYP